MQNSSLADGLLPELPQADIEQRKIDHPRFFRYVKISSDRIVHVLRLTSVDDVDDEVKQWLTEAYVVQ